MKIRIADVNDSHAIAKLHTESWRTTYRGLFSDKYLDGPVEQERLECWQKRLATPPENQFALVAVNENELLGFVCIFLKSDSVYGTLIDNLHVRAFTREKGVGTQLLQSVANWLITQDPNCPIYLWALEKNQRARTFYENLQGKTVETRKELQVDGSIVPSVRYSWLNPAFLLSVTTKKIEKKLQLESSLRFSALNKHSNETSRAQSTCIYESKI